jgi:hypothetical protein
MTPSERYPLSWPTGWKRATTRKQARFGKRREQGYGRALCA